jgi:transcriptional regulator of aromatic amino acid metabolism
MEKMENRQEIANLDVPVLIKGESGTGKEIVAIRSMINPTGENPDQDQLRCYSQDSSESESSASTRGVYHL